MPIYTFESEHSLDKIRGKLVVPDTSYLISLFEENRLFLDFHSNATVTGTLFYINVIVRTEFTKAVRKSQLIKAILSLVNKDLVTARRYRTLLGMPNAAFTAVNLGSGDAYNKIYKDHVRKGDLQLLLSNLEDNIWRSVQWFERNGKFNYMSGRDISNLTQNQGTQISWDSLGNLLQETCLNSSDAMIANFAFSIGADAIVTTDTDFAQISDRIDIYMPGDKADMCKAYDPVED